MSKFIEVTDHTGRKYLQNTSRIDAVLALDKKWAEEWKEDHDSPELVASRIITIGRDGGYGLRVCY